ncbi:MAG: hypothetical protein M3Q27_08875 [Actinomycetota bacterium]|nr:hypothetical protein [Actinomycetota bacterium]
MVAPSGLAAGLDESLRGQVVFDPFGDEGESEVVSEFDASASRASS